MRAVAVGCALALAAVSCRSEPPQALPDELRAAAEPVASLDPLVASADGSTGEALVLAQIYEGLVSHAPETLRPRPALAASWSVSSDARTFTFMLRDGAVFHSGEPVRARDVVWSLNRLARAACEPESSPRAGAPSFLLSGVVGYPEVAGACRRDELPGLVPLSEDTVMVSLSQPWADFVSILGHPATTILPEGTTDDQARLEPVGTGPYRVARPWDGTSLLLERFEDYWGLQARIGGVRVVGYPDDGAAYLDLLQGKLHYAPVPLSRTRHARREFGDGGFARGVGISFFGFNLRSERVVSLPFRRALSAAVDREALATAIFEGTREAAGGLASPSLPGVEEPHCGSLCEHDPEAARRLVAEAHPDGPPEIVIGVSEEGGNPSLGEAVAEMFSEIGVTARVVVRPLAEHVEGLEAGDVDLFQFGWIPAYSTLDALLWPLFRSPSPDNHMRYANDEVDGLLTSARSVLDHDERAQIHREAERRIVDDAPVLPLLWYRSSLALDRRLHSEDGPPVDGLGRTSFSGLRFEAR